MKLLSKWYIFNKYSVNQKEVSEYVKIFENTHKELKEEDDKMIKQNEDNINSIKKE